MTPVTPLRGEARAFIVRVGGRLVRVARVRDAWVASRPSGCGLRAWHSAPERAIRAYLEDS